MAKDLSSLFPPLQLTLYQQEIVDTEVPLVACVWGRQTGKTETAYAVAEKRLKAGDAVLFLSATQQMAVRTVRNYNGPMKQTTGSPPRQQLVTLDFNGFREQYPNLDAYDTVIIDEAGMIADVMLETFLTRNRFGRLYLFGTPLNLRKPKDVPSTFEFATQGRFNGSIDSWRQHRGHLVSHVTTFEAPFVGDTQMVDAVELLPRRRLMTEYLARFVDRTANV